MDRVSQSVADLVRAEFEKVFSAHEEPMDKGLYRDLIINVAIPGGFVNKTHNPHLPLTTAEVTRQVTGAYHAGATMWHVDPRDPEVPVGRVPIDKRIRFHKEWCDSVFEKAPDMITNVGGISFGPPALVGNVIEERSILAEIRMAPFVDQFIKLGPRNRYIEVASLSSRTNTVAGTNLLLINNKPSFVSDVNLLQSRGIRLELFAYEYSDIQDMKEWVLDSGIAKQPIILDTVLGIHNTPMPTSLPQGLELLFTLFRVLPKGVLWHMVAGGRYWLPLTAAAIMMGADMVRVGFEDAVHMYPHREDYIKEGSQVVEAVAGIARCLGREIATAKKAREMLRLPD
ncbi:MAG TPA: 3-keto-5-aminohexanoate cleavage protein [Thermodesulfobacteriota bacterium]|nr:3-keto-5-aminohexanoate cleavage protein [Thermodesulfobacteriota bacterium]